MPPRTTKKTPPGPGSKRALRGRAAAAAAALAANSQAQAAPEEPNVKLEEIEVAEEGRPPVAVGKETEQEETVCAEERVALESDNASVKSKPCSLCFRIMLYTMAICDWFCCWCRSVRLKGSYY